MLKIILTFALLFLVLYLLRYNRAKSQSLRKKRRDIIEKMRQRIESQSSATSKHENRRN